MRPRISTRGSVRPWVRPERVFFNAPIMAENSRKWLGKQSKCSKPIIKSSELSQNVPNCFKMSTSDASLSEWTCFHMLAISRFTLQSKICLESTTTIGKRYYSICIRRVVNSQPKLLRPFRRHISEYISEWNWCYSNVVEERLPQFLNQRKEILDLRSVKRWHFFFISGFFPRQKQIFGILPNICLFNFIARHAHAFKASGGYVLGASESISRPTSIQDRQQWQHTCNFLQFCWNYWIFQDLSTFSSCFFLLFLWIFHKFSSFCSNFKSDTISRPTLGASADTPDAPLLKCAT